MKSVNEKFKTNIKKYGRQIDAIISFDDKTITKEDINSISPNFHTTLFKSVMHELEIDSNVKIEEGTIIDAKIGVKFGNDDYEYVEYKNYIVYSCEKQEDTESYKIIAYDKMLEAMTEFKLAVQYPITVKNYLIKIFEKLNWNKYKIPDKFVNSEKQIITNIHADIQYTYRDVLDEIATVTGSFIFFSDDVIQLKYITETNETIDEEVLSEDDVTIRRKLFYKFFSF